MPWSGLQGLAEEVPLKLSTESHEEPAWGELRRGHCRKKEQLCKGPGLGRVAC